MNVSVVIESNARNAQTTNSVQAVSMAAGVITLSREQAAAVAATISQALYAEGDDGTSS